MLGPEKRREEQLFYYGFSLEERVPADHPLRAVRQLVDFSFVRDEVAHLCGDRGNPSEDPIVVLKLLFLKFFSQTRSMRQVMRDLPCRLDWLWFCEFDVTDSIPDHSVISKARRRWGRKVFVSSFFQRVLQNCVDAGLVDGGVVHVDGSVVAADASDDSIQVQLHLISAAIYDEEASADGDEEDESSPPPESTPESTPESPSPPSGTRVSRTDPDARLTRKNGRRMLGYKDHRVIDDRCGIVTATITTPADTNEPHLLGQALQHHEANTGRVVKTVAADRQYGTAANYRMLHDSEVTPCIPHKRVREDPTKFPRRLFVYDPAHDRYTCPANQHLTRRARSDGARWRYRADAGVCAACSMKRHCTDAAAGRAISRQVDQAMIDWADGCLSRSQRTRLMARRKSKAEGSFADATNHHGSKRMRWRGLTNAGVQNLLIATIQNIRKLIRVNRKPRSAGQTRPTPRIAAPALIMPHLVNMIALACASATRLAPTLLPTFTRHQPR